MSWPDGGLRRVSVNSFGFGGSNAHVILDDAFHYLQSRGMAGIHHCNILTMTNGHCENNNIGTSKSYQKITSRLNGEVKPLYPPTTTTNLLVWSAHDERALKRMIKGYENFYKSRIVRSHASLSQLAYTLSARRSLMSWRAFAVVDASEAHSLEKVGIVSKPIRASNRNNIAVVFTGQGASYAEMGLELRQYAVFEDSLQRANTALQDLGCGWSILGKWH